MPRVGDFLTGVKEESLLSDGVAALPGREHKGVADGRLCCCWWWCNTDGVKDADAVVAWWY